MRIDRAGFPFVAAAVVPAAGFAAARRYGLAALVRAAWRVLRVFLPRSGTSRSLRRASCRVSGRRPDHDRGASRRGFVPAGRRGPRWRSSSRRSTSTSTDHPLKVASRESSTDPGASFLPTTPAPTRMSSTRFGSMRTELRLSSGRSSVSWRGESCAGSRRGSESASENGLA